MNKLNGYGHFWVRKKKKSTLIVSKKLIFILTESLSEGDKVNFVKFVFGFEKTPLDGFKYVGTYFFA